MNGPVLTMCLLAYALMAALPFTFFRRGRLNGRWLLTAAPFIIAAASLLAGMAGVLAPLPPFTSAAPALGYAAVCLTGAAIALLGCTLGVHREAISLWHQEDDAPAALVTRGPYARIRHPFYTSFLLMLAGTACALPHPATLSALALGCIQLWRTARREERRLLASRFGAEYAGHMTRTGRFIPVSHIVWRDGPAGIFSRGARGESGGLRRNVHEPLEQRFGQSELE